MRNQEGVFVLEKGVFSHSLHASDVLFECGDVSLFSRIDAIELLRATLAADLKYDRREEGRGV